MSNAEVMAMLPLHVRTFWTSRLGTPCGSLRVTQPALPSLVFPRTRVTSSSGSLRGPSSTSRSSPGSSSRTSALPDSQSSVRATGPAVACRRKSGLAMTSRKAVPWLPLRVIQPSLLSSTARHLTRSKPVFSSMAFWPRTSTASPGSILRTVLLALTSKLVVSAISLTHLLYSCSRPRKASSERPPAPRRLRSSCRPFREPPSTSTSRSVAAGISSLPFASSEKRASIAMEVCSARARSAAAAASCASTTTLLRALLSASSCLLDVESRGASLVLSLSMTRRASAKGALLEPRTSSIFFFTICSVAACTDASTASSSRSALAMASRGSSSSLVLPALTSALAAETAASTSFSRLSTVSLDSLIMVSAATLSAASCRFCLSASSSSSRRRWASATFFLRLDWAVCALLARTRIFMSSALTSVSEPTPWMPLISSDFCFR
mmetsp:Transcript_87200/g.247239  ORF Transcript_87200/g.247239 Transcript_87200/m.247239 type:complete len:438 (-) Transcript_87200:1309-2622(-)